MSPYLQELLVYTGESLVFDEAGELLEKLLHIPANGKQAERLCHHYGQKLEEQSPPERVEKDTRLHYAMVDGGMVLTREESWKELKVGRVFPAAAVLPENEQRDFIASSAYTAHLGSREMFFDKLSAPTDALPNLVWIADGARWIWNWVEDYYPEAVQILDYYHCKEKLCLFAQHAFKEQAERKQWVAEQEGLLLADQVGIVIANVAFMHLKGEAKKQQHSLLSYYSNNRARMRYGTYRQKGYLIGSGAIEAAIRQLIQQRLKLSGQRWTKQGAQQMANLRVAKKSGDWLKVKNLIANQN